MGGCGAALKFADKGWHVTILEMKTLFSGTSGRVPARMGLGFHYADLATGIAIMHQAVRFVKTCPGLRVGEHLDYNHPLRHGRYFIAKDSLFSVSELLNTYDKLKEEYRRLVDMDPTNEVFGHPDDFYRIMDRKEYEDVVDCDKIELGLWTQEHMINLPKFLCHLKKLVEEHPQITVIEDTKVVGVQCPGAGNKRYTIETKCKGQCKSYDTDYVINSSWNEIERLNGLAGFPDIPSRRMNRLKVLVEVELPEEMVNVNSMFFCMGPFCMFSNMGNGHGTMTYAHVTNVEINPDRAISEEMSRLLYQGPTSEEFTRYGESLLAGVSSYIPPLKNAKIVSVRFGIVQTHGRVNILEKRSSFHKRSYHGIREDGPGWVSNPCMKLFNFLWNGDTTWSIMNKRVEKDMKKQEKCDHKDKIDSLSEKEILERKG